VLLPRVETTRTFLDVLDAIVRRDLGDLREHAPTGLSGRVEVLA
jgi:hypothetical protein